MNLRCTEIVEYGHDFRTRTFHIMSETRISIRVRRGSDTFPMVVGSLDAVMSIVKKEWESPNLIIVYNNSILSGAFSFAFYNIEDGSTLDVREHVARKKQRKQKHFLFNWARCKSQVDEDEQSSCAFKNLLEPSLAREVARIRDRFFQRVEGTIKSHRSLLSHFSRKQKEEEDKQEK